MTVRTVRVWWHVTTSTWAYDCGPGTAVQYATNVMLLTSCHTCLNLLGEWPNGPKGYIEAFDVDVIFNYLTYTLTIREAYVKV